MNNIDFNWDIKPQNSIFTNGVPTEEDLNKYGILNVIDYHFDGDKKTPYELDCGNSNVINSFLLNAWDFLRNIDDTLVDAYLGAASDAANYILALSRFKKRRFYLSGVTSKNKQRYLGTAINNATSQLYNYYLDRKNFYLKNKIDQRFGYNNNYKINVYIVKGTKTYLLESNTKLDSSILNKSQEYFEYYIDSDFYVDMLNEPSSSLFILFELIDAIRQSLETYKEGQYNNIYEEYLKLYFYKVLTEKYRTKEIEEQLVTLIKKNDFDQANVIPNLYGKLDGKNGTLRAPNITETTKNSSKNNYNYFILPFYRATFNNNTLSIYVDKWSLPASFNIVKKYNNIRSYILKDTSFFKRIFNDAKALVVDENFDVSLSDDNLYSVARDYVNENVDYLTDLKITELVDLVRPYFNEEYTDISEETKYDINCIINKASNDFAVNDIIFGEEVFNNENHFFAKFIINIDCDLNSSILGAGYIKVQQKTAYGRDNQVSNFVTTNIDELKVFDGEKITKCYGDDISNKIQELKNKDKFEYIREYNIPEQFKTALDDKEISIIHIHKDSDLPHYKISKITTDGNKYYLDVSKFYLYNNVDNIKQVCVLDNETNNEYLFNVIGTTESVSFKKDDYLLVSNEAEKLEGDYILNDTLYMYLINGINGGEIKVEKNSIGNNEIVINSEATGISTIVGDTIIIGKEYDAGIIDGKHQYIKIVLDDDGDYCLELYLKDIYTNNKIEVVDSYDFVINKQLIINKTSEVEEYLNTVSIGEEGGSVVFIIDFIQRNYGTKAAYLDDYIDKKPIVDENNISYSWEIVNHEFKS